MAQEAEDPREGPLHPRHRYLLRGHADAETRLLQALGSGKMHHGWLLAGPRGIGKATLAYRLARFVLQYTNPEQIAGKNSLYVPPEAPVSRRVASGGHADLLVLERSWDEKTKRVKSEISVAGAREVTGFLSRTAGEGGWRICIVDAADDLGSESANAILKTLEEPPPRCLFILVSHQPGSLLPTIRSRCIRLDLSPLSLNDTVAVLHDLETEASEDIIQRSARLSEGSPGRAIELLDSAGAAAFAKVLETLVASRRLDSGLRVRTADQFTGRTSTRDFEIFCELLQDWTAREARQQALSGRGEVLARAYEQTGHSLRMTNALNLDRRQAVLDALDALETALKAA
jgi:DNA polymerase-3 subunit delta'